MSGSPSPNGADRADGPDACGGSPELGTRGRRSPRAGRDAGGRFQPGNPGGPGNPHAATVGALRSALLAAVTADDIRAVARALVDQARAGDVSAARELLNRLLGPAVETDLIARLEALEHAAESANARTQWRDA